MQIIFKLVWKINYIIDGGN